MDNVYTIGFGIDVYQSFQHYCQIQIYHTSKSHLKVILSQFTYRIQYRIISYRIVSYLVNRKIPSKMNMECIKECNYLVNMISLTNFVVNRWFRSLLLNRMKSIRTRLYVIDFILFSPTLHSNTMSFFFRFRFFYRFLPPSLLK